MRTLWTFGDSFTTGDGCVDNIVIRHGDYTYYNEYKQLNDDIWPNILSKSLGYDIKNIGKSGASNDYIIDSIIDNFDNIQLGDIVIIEKTFNERFDIPRLNDNIFETQYGETLYHMHIDLENNIFDRSKEEVETILNYAVLFAGHNLFKERQNKRFNFIKKQLSKKIDKILFWDLIDFRKSNIETITEHTNGKINDYHFSFNGHKEISKIFYKKLEDKKSLI